MIRKGITFVEVLVSAVILASVISGILATFVSVRRVVGKGAERLIASNLARRQLDSLYPAVRADKWDDADMTNNTLADGQHDAVADGALGTVALGGVNYVVYYNVTAPVADPGAEYKEAMVNITFTIPT